MKKLVLLGVIIIFLITFVGTGTAMAGKPSTSEFTWWQAYCGWGPGEYYGENVLVHYESINRWVLNKQATDGGWNIEQALTQSGTADVYELGDVSCSQWSASEPTGYGDLIASGLKFHVVENTKGHVTTDKSWYHVSQVDTLQEWNYHWIINGVYHYFASYHNGEWDSKILFP